VFVLDAQGKPKALPVRLGISDGTSTELLISSESDQADKLQEGMQVITGLISGNPPARPAAAGPRPLF
jgi:HlyD family secretion protein